MEIILKNIYYKCYYCGYINNNRFINDRYVKQLYVYYSEIYDQMCLTYNYHIMLPYESKNYTNLLLCFPLNIE